MEILKLNKINKYYGKTHALKDINFSVKKGEVVVILGPSGCGKSTTLRCINGLEEIQSGEMEILGEKIDKIFKIGVKFVKKSVWFFKVMNFLII